MRFEFLLKIAGWWALSCVAVLLSSVTVLAQDEGDSVLDEVVVRATRIPIAWNRLPVAVAWVDQDEIQLGRQQLGLDESLVNIPGVFSQNRYNFAQDLRVSIRGFGARANFGIRGIMLIADDIPLTMPDGQGNVDSLDLGSAESVEVVRGPSSAIYGASSGGVITIRTEEGPETPYLAGRVSGGSYGFFMAQAKAGGQTGNLNWIANLSDTNLDGYREQSRYQRTLWNSKFRYDFADDSTLTLVFNAVDSPTGQDPGALTLAEAKANPRQAAPRNLEFDADESVTQESLGLAWRKPISDHHELLLRAWGVQRDFQNLLPFSINANGQGGNVELDRVVGGLGGHWTWSRPMNGSRQNRLVLGFDLSEQRDLRQRFANNQGVAGILTTNQDEDVSAASLFFEDALNLSEDFLFTLGARFDDMEYSANDRTNRGGSGKTDFQRVSPMVGLSWSGSSWVSMYGTISTSFDPPALAELVNPEGPTGFNASLGPQTATNYEVGFKGLGQDTGRIRYELAVFHIDVKDEIVAYELNGAGQAFYRNAGQSTHEGIEAGVVAEVVPGLTARLAYTWSDFTFKDFSEPVSGGSGLNVYDGNRIPGVPQNQAHLEFTWQPASGFYAGIDFLYVGPFFANNANTVETDAYFISNLRTGYRWSSGAWSLEPFVGLNNLFDKAYMDNIRINATFGRYYEPAPERNIYGGMELRYGF